MTTEYLQITFRFTEKNDPYHCHPLKTTAKYGEKIREIARRSGISDDYKLYQFVREETVLLCIILDEHVLLRDIILSVSKKTPYVDMSEDFDDGLEENDDGTE